MNHKAKQGLIGHPLGHSFSPFIHEMLSEKPYELIDIASDKLKETLNDQNYLGFNITIPYKEEVIKYLDEIDPTSASIQAVNTVVRRNNKLIGYNTDTQGFIELLNYYNIDLTNQTVLILGTGGTKKTISFVLSTITNNLYYSTRGKTIKEQNQYNYDDLNNISKRIDYIINTTPVGMNPNIDYSPVNLDLFPSLKGVIDVIYNPYHTTLLLQAKERKIPYYNGLMMLVYQAYYASNLFYNQINDKNKLTKIYQELLLNTSSILLIGMPAVGKTLIGKKLSQRLNKKFIDLDDEITKKYQKEPKDIVSEEGINNFRNKEHLLLKEYQNQTGSIISSGGGLIENKNNYDLIKHHYLIIYLKRNTPLGNLDNSRPITPSIDKWYETFKKRKNEYENWADMIINVKDDVNETIEEIINQLKRK